MLWKLNSIAGRKWLHVFPGDSCVCEIATSHQSKQNKNKMLSFVWNVAKLRVLFLKNAKWTWMNGDTGSRGLCFVCVQTMAIVVNVFGSTLQNQQHIQMAFFRAVAIHLKWFKFGWCRCETLPFLGSHKLYASPNWINYYVVFSISSGVVRAVYACQTRLSQNAHASIHCKFDYAHHLRKCVNIQIDAANGGSLRCQRIT